MFLLLLLCSLKTTCIHVVLCSMKLIHCPLYDCILADESSKKRKRKNGHRKRKKEVNQREYPVPIVTLADHSEHLLLPESIIQGVVL